MVVFGSPKVLEGVEVIEFRRRVTEHAELLKFDPSALVKQLPMIQTNDELFAATTQSEKEQDDNHTWGFEEPNS